MSSCDNSNIKKNYIVTTSSEQEILSACTGLYTNNLYPCDSNNLTVNSNLLITNDINVSGLLTSYGGVTNLSGKFLSGTTNGFVLSDISNIQDNNTFTTGTTLSGSTIIFNRNDLTNAYSVDLSPLKFTGNTSGDCITELFVSNINSCSPLHIQPTNSGDVYILENGGKLGIGTNNPNVLLDVNGDVHISNSLSATTFYGDGSNLRGINNFYVTGGTFSSGSLTLDRNDGNSVIVTGFTSDDFYVTGGTYNSLTETIDFKGNSLITTFTVDVSELLDDTNTFTTGTTLSGSTIIFNRNDLTNAYSVDLTPIVSGFSSFDTYVTGFTYNNNTFTILQNSGTTLSTNISVMTGLTVNGQTIFSGSSDNVVTIIGSGSTNPLFTISGSSGELFSVSDNLTGNLLSVNNINSDSILIVRDDNTVLFGTTPTLSLNTTINETVLSGNVKTLYIIPSGYTSSYFDYNVFGSNGVRAGNVMGIWSGTSIQYTEVTTNDIGNTSDFNIYMEMSGTTTLLRCSATTYNWNVKSIVRLI
jgi:hypothetical protein